MEKFYLRVLNGEKTYTTDIVAEEFEVGETGRIYYFKDDDENIIATYPTHLTIIEKVESVDIKSTDYNNKIKHNITEI